jgi:hypothetical protein
MNPCRTTLANRLACGLAAGLCAAWLVGTEPALAKDKDKASDREVNEARDACKQIAEGRDWKNVRTNVRDSSDERVVMAVSGKRRGEDRDRECRYNIKRHQAEFDDQG